jgi:Zn-dependent protease
MGEMSANIGNALLYFAAFLFSTTLHEAAHAWAALRGGDQTAYLGGQVSLDPMPHIRREPIGMVALPLLTALLTGWPFGYASAPYDPAWARRHPDRAAWMALAGPGANLLLVLLSGAALRIGTSAGVFVVPDTVRFGAVSQSLSGAGWETVGLLLGVMFSLNLLLTVFNLLPLPPLDGSAAVTLLLPERMVARYQEVIWTTPMLGWVGIFVAWQVIPVVFQPVFTAAVNLVYPGASYS